MKELIKDTRGWKREGKSNRMMKAKRIERKAKGKENHSKRNKLEEKVCVEKSKKKGVGKNKGRSG